MSDASAIEHFETTSESEFRESNLSQTRHVGLLVFTTMSLTVMMAVGQDFTFEPGSFAYWLFVIPAAVLPLFDAGLLAHTLTRRAKILLLFLLLGGIWQLARGDTRAALQLALFVLVLTWISTDRARFDVGDLAKVYLGLVVVGALVYAVSDINGWGLLPGTTRDEYGVWRTSFFPNIGNTGTLSAAMFFILTKDAATARAHRVALTVTTYFLILSFVRAALIAAVVYVALRWWFGRGASPKRLFWGALIVAVGIHVAIVFSVAVLVDAQRFPIVSRLLLQSASDLSPEQIFNQIYRPWLWGQHLAIFAASPSLMGWGAFDFFELRPQDIMPGYISSAGSEALLTRLLASYGLAAVCFIGFLLARLRESASAHDRWACACFPAIIVLIMNWGSVFHPTSAMFALFFVILVRGRKGFVSAADRP